MNKTFLDKIKSTLLSHKQEILLKSAQDPSQHEIDVDGDETDEIQGNMLLEVSKKLATRDISRLNDIDQALEKIANSTYGSCEDCGDEIAEKRLLHNPHFLTCIGCAEDREMASRQRRRM